MESRKKILFLVTQSEFGGAQRFIYTLVTALRRYAQNQFASQNTQINADNQLKSVSIDKSVLISVSPKADNQRKSADYEIVVAAGPEGNDANGLLFNLKKQGFNQIPLKFIRRAINPIIDFLGLIEIRRLIKKEKPDILFLCSTKAGFLGSLAARIYQRKSAYSEGSNQRISAKSLEVIYRIGGWTFNDPWPKWKKNLYLWLEKKTAKFKDIIVNNATSETMQAKELGITPRKEILTIFNGIDVEKLKFLHRDEARKEIFRRYTQNQFASQNTQINADNQRESACLAGRQAYSEGQNLRISAVVGTIANFYPAKGLEYLIEAANILNHRYAQNQFTLQNTRTNVDIQRESACLAGRQAYSEGQNQRVSANIKFIIIGEGIERNKLVKLSEKWGLDNVFMPGAILESYKYLKAFDIFVLPSVKEGFPWTILEAMAAEIPVIATKVGAIPELIEDGENGILIEPKNPKAIADSIEKLMHDKNLAEKLAKNGRKTVIEKFTLKKMVSSFEELFK